MKKRLICFCIVFLVLFIPISFAKTIHPISKETIKVEQVDIEGEEKRSVASDVYYYYGTGLIAKEENNQLEYIHKDNLGSTRVVTNEFGDITESNTYLPYGENLDSSREIFTFTGKELDSSGLQYFGARYYDPNIGRFISVDPIGDGGNWYEYAASNPLKFVDPSGLERVLAIRSTSDYFGGGPIDRDFGGLVNQLIERYGEENVVVGVFSNQEEFFSLMQGDYDVRLISGHGSPASFDGIFSSDIAQQSFSSAGGIIFLQSCNGATPVVMEEYDITLQSVASALSISTGGSTVYASYGKMSYSDLSFDSAGNPSFRTSAFDSSTERGLEEYASYSTIGYSGGFLGFGTKMDPGRYYEGTLMGQMFVRDDDNDRNWMVGVSSAKQKLKNHYVGDTFYSSAEVRIPNRYVVSYINGFGDPSNLGFSVGDTLNIDDHNPRFSHVVCGELLDTTRIIQN